MSDPVKITIPTRNFTMSKRPPSSGERTTETTTITGTDYTEITIPPNAIYKNDSTTNYQSQYIGDGTIEFTITFPQNTTYITTSGAYEHIFTSPSNIYYRIEDTETLIDNTSTPTIEVKNGKIDISLIKGSNDDVNENKDYTPDSLEKIIAEKAKVAGEEMKDNFQKIVYYSFNKI